MSLQPLYVSPLEIHACVGAVVNKDNEHWVALKSVSGEVWCLDSLERPRKMPKDEYAKFIETRRAAYPIYLAEQMTASSGAPSFGDSPLLPLASQDMPADDSMMSID